MGHSNQMYEDEGFENRTEYLEYLSDEYQMPLSFIKKLARTIGREGDFDELIEAIEEAIEEALEEMEEREEYKDD
jgi:Ni,Fe-hydrogenase maturation factor